MLAIAYFLLYELCGLGILFLLKPRMLLTVRIWLGLCLGIVMMMWLPALCAFFWDFSMKAHLIAMIPLFLLTGGAYLGRDKRDALSFGEKDKGLLWLLLFTALPLSLIGGYLQWTHNIMPLSNGTLHVGQSTYGDLPLHLAIASSLRNASFPPDYNILPGSLLTYPFLADSLSTSFMILGFDLRSAILFPALIMTALTFSGYVILAHRLADTHKGAALAALFFFVNGGLGFFYLFDMQGKALGFSGNNELQSVAGLWERIKLVLNGWYQTPANHTEFTTYNLRWSNVIVDMMVPQRTTLAGWCLLIPCLYLLYDALRPENAQNQGIHMAITPDGPTAVYVKRRLDLRHALLLGVWAGMLPMVNTHCFLALGLLSAGWMIYDLISSRGQLFRALCFWGVYGFAAVLLAAPQLFTWTFNQAVGNDRFLQLTFNWVNGAQGMLDGYFWFYLKNIGIPFALILLALLEKNAKRRFLAAGAFMIFLAAEFIQFQPNVYDNNKLLYVWYMICCVIAADYGLELLGKLKGMRAKPVIAALAAFCCFFTGALAIARECKSDYQMFSKEEVAAAKYIEEKTDREDIFMTWTQHINFVSSLAGRNIVCGPDNWLYFHGFSTWERQQDIRAFYADPMGNLDLARKYGVDYILIGGNERYNLTIDTHAFENHFEKVYAGDYGNIVIYAMPGEE